MRTQVTILIAAIFVGGSISGAIVASTYVNHYALAAAQRPDDNPFVWRLDTRTGEILACSFTRNLDSEPADPANPFDQIFADAQSPYDIRCTNVAGVPRSKSKAPGKDTRRSPDLCSERRRLDRLARMLSMGSSTLAHYNVSLYPS